MIDTNFLEIIQGDTYSLRVSMDKDEIENVDSVVWTCSDVGLIAELERNDLTDSDGKIDYGFDVTLTSQQTSQLDAMRTVYNITITYTDDSIETGVYQGLMRIYEKDQVVLWQR